MRNILVVIALLIAVGASAADVREVILTESLSVNLTNGGQMTVRKGEAISVETTDKNNVNGKWRGVLVTVPKSKTNWDAQTMPVAKPQVAEPGAAWIGQANDLLALRKAYESAAARIATEAERQRAVALGEYGRALDAGTRLLKEQGDIDGYVAVEKEVKRFQAEKTVATQTPHAIVADAMGAYQKQLSAADTERSNRMYVCVTQYITALNGLTKRLMSQDKIEDAREVGDVRDAAGLLLEAIRASKTPTEISMLDLRANGTPLKLSGFYRNRAGDGRAEACAEYGGTEKTESAVLRGLRWLKTNQKADGSWSNSSPVAMGGLALLCYLAHGETPDSKEFGVTVLKAMQYLADRMAGQNGAIIEREYSHGIATYALAEAYGMTKIPFLKGAMENGLKTIVAGQQLGGGWDYGYAKNRRWDLSVSGWQIQALKAGLVAGSETPGLAEALERSIGWLKKENFNNGGFCYSNSGGPSPSMTGCGTFCLQFLGEGRASEVKSGVQYIGEKCKVAGQPEMKGFATYGWYYQTQAMFHAGSSYWTKWNHQLSRELTTSQKPDGHWESGDGGEYGPLLDTTLCCLMLEVYYRYPPAFRTAPH